MLRIRAARAIFRKRCSYPANSFGGLARVYGRTVWKMPAPRSLLLLAAALLCCIDAQSVGSPGSVASRRRQAFAAANAPNPEEAALLFGAVAELEPGV